MFKNLPSSSAQYTDRMEIPPEEDEGQKATDNGVRRQARQG
jgi:hypothetical protein